MNAIRISMLALVVCGLFAGCMSTEEEYDPRVGSDFSHESQSTKTPTDERIADLLLNAKQAYDDGHYESSFRYAEGAESLVKEHEMALRDQALAVVIQGYCLLQLGYVDNYYVEGVGIQVGAITKFKKALKLGTTDFRATLGVGLALFRRHGDHIRKVNALTKGASALYAFEFNALEGMNKLPEADGKVQIKRALKDVIAIIADGQKMADVGYVFRDPSTVALGMQKIAPLLGNLEEGQTKLLGDDVIYALEDAAKTGLSNENDFKMVDANTTLIRDNWLDVRKYWQTRAIKDLQEARDMFLALRKAAPGYFWVDRDLTFTYQSIGAFFLDISLDIARNQAIAERVRPHEVEARTDQIFLSDDFNPWQTADSQKNYSDALDFLQSFMISHQKFVALRINRRDNNTFDDETENPFLADLVRISHGVMSDLIAEEEEMRSKLVLEAASMCIDPQFQLNDIPRALGYARQLKAMDARNPIHYFVAATAYFQDKDWELAKAAYEAFMSGSSISEDGSQRTISRRRIMECEVRIKKERSGQ
ncbi:MAG: hypothetical protein L3J82_08965 [Planctomycetes bacterium]|nr:hypothetical protein [Planctomycetota bacterium]